MSKIKIKLKNLAKYTANHRYYIFLCIPFLLMDLAVRIMGFKISFYPAYMPIPLLFSIIYCLLFVGISTALKPLAMKILYWFFFALSYVLFFTNIIYYNLTDLYFGFNLLKMADEGSSYVIDVVLGADWYIYAVAVLVLAASIVIAHISIKHIIDSRNQNSTDQKKKNHPLRQILVCIVLFLLLHTLLPLLYGTVSDELVWDTFRNPKSVYDNFNDVNKSMRVAGLYEFSVRNFYINFLKPAEQIDDEDQALLEGFYETSSTEENEYTGIFEGKNVIFLQLEGIDTWLLDEETMPNLYAVKQESLDFSSGHYSMYTGGGSTFNSEFGVNTGFMTPVSYVENVYSFSSNTFPYTLPKLFSALGYDTNAFHKNSAEFYSRGINYTSWGYDKYNSLQDNGVNWREYDLDRYLILNEEFYDTMFKHDGLFLDYIITFTPHTPFHTTSGVGELVASLTYGDDVPELSEEETARLMAAETDCMVGLLMQALKDEGLYDNTVLVIYADHYLYSIDNSVLEQYKDTSNNLVNNTPFFIWSSDIEPGSVDTVNMQMDILPTVLNMFGIDYNPNNYIGQDIFSDDFRNFVYFSDYSWYDGDTYVEDGEVVSGKTVSDEYISEIGEKVYQLIQKNDLTLKYDYFAE